MLLRAGVPELSFEGFSRQVENLYKNQELFTGRMAEPLHSKDIRQLIAAHLLRTGRMDTFEMFAE